MALVRPAAAREGRVDLLRRQRREARVRTALARVPAHLMADASWEGVSARAEAFGIVPGQVYGPRGLVAQPFGPYDAYVGEVMLGGMTFAPNGWADCNGALLPISEYDTLFSLLGTTYGGDGQETFALPNLSGRFPMHQGQGPGLSNRVMGQASGAEQVTLTTAQMPAHTHFVGTAQGGDTGTPGHAASVDLASAARFAATPSADRMGPTGLAGGSQPMGNLPPYLGIRFCISLFGIFPSQS